METYDVKNKIVFFGTDEFAVAVLDELCKLGSLPALIVTTEDKPKGRKLVVTPPPVKVWAISSKIPYLQPTKLDESFRSTLYALRPTLFVVASYGKILPKFIFDLPTNETLNIHPSLLPKLRGPSPLQTAVLNEDETGVTIIRLDEEMDHGPIVAQRKILIEPWPIEQNLLRDRLAREGARLLVESLPDWVDGGIKAIPQDHAKATYTRKIKKEDGLIDLNGDPEKNYRKILAYSGWPSAYFFSNKNANSSPNFSTKNLDGQGKTRVIIKKAHLENGRLVIEKVLPEGSSKEISFQTFNESF